MVPHPAMPRELQAAIVSGAEAHRKSMYGLDTVERAQRWKTDDVASVHSASSVMMYAHGNVPHAIGDIIIRRSMDPNADYLDHARNLIHNNPGACAKIADRSDPVTETGLRLYPVFGETTKFVGSNKLSSAVASSKDVAALQNGGINGVISDVRDTRANSYHAPEHMIVEMKLADVLSRGGRIHRDVGAYAEASVLIEMPRGVGLPYRQIDAPPTSAKADEPYDPSWYESPFATEA